jgi:hypothetical protein
MLTKDEIHCDVPYGPQRVKLLNIEVERRGGGVKEQKILIIESPPAQT